MPTTRYFASQSFADMGLAMQQIVRFLVNDHATITGPGWTVVEAWDAGEAELETPSDTSDLDTFSNVLSWSGATTLNVGDWIVLESADANNTNHFQVYMEYNAATSMEIMMIPFQDFVTGSSFQSPALFPTSSFGDASGSFVSMVGYNSTATYSCVADEGMAMLWFHNDTTTFSWTYLGEVDAIHTSGTHADTRCYVIYDDTANVGLMDSNADVRVTRLSPVDNVTVIENGYFTPWYLWGQNQVAHTTGVTTGALGHWIFPPGLYFNSTGHEHFAGWPRNLYSVHEDIGDTVGTISGANYVFFTNEAEPRVAMSWDGTAYGTDFSATLVIPPQHVTASISGTFYENFMAEVFHPEHTFYYISGTTIYPFQTGSFSTGSDGGGSSPSTGSQTSGSNIDRHRLRVTYPSFRRKQRPGTLSDS